MALTLFVTIIPVSAQAFLGIPNFFPSSQAAEDDVPYYNPEDIDPLEAATHSDTNLFKGDPDIQFSDSALVGNSGPEGALPAAGGATGGGSISVYQVREGDSLSEIADTFNVSISTILWANDIKDPKTIRPGDTLVILPVSGVQYTVKKGGTLSDVAKLFDADVDEIAIFNGIDVDTELAAGQTLIIPGGEQKSAATTKTTSSTKKTTTAKSTGGTTTVASGYFINPLPGGILTQSIHGANGVDVGSPSGTPIRAAADGTVIISKGNGAWNGGYGSYVVITHANGTQTLYAHMSKDIVTVGATVSAGDVIGYVGRTGEATGNHLHFEVRGGKNPFAGCATMKVCTFK